MAWTDKYIASFKDKSKDIITIQIQQDPLVDNEEPITLADEPLTIYVPPKDLDHQIWGLGCRINLVNLGALNKYDHIIEAAERDHRVIIRKGPAATAEANRALIFKGFITPDIHSQQLKGKPEFSLTANNQLSGLKNYYSDLLADTGDFSTIPLIDLMQDILDSTDMDLPIYIKNTLFSTLYVATYSIANVCYDKLRINRQIYVDQDEIMDGYSILEDILKVTYSRLYYMDGKWIIDRYTDVGNTTAYKTYPHPYTETPGDTTLVHEGFDLADEKMIGNSGNLDYQSGKKIFRLIIDFDRYDNLIDPLFISIRQFAVSVITDSLPIGTWHINSFVTIENRSHSSINTSTGLHYNMSAITAGDRKKTALTTMAYIDPASFSVTYAYDDLQAATEPIWHGGFRVRYKVGDNWRVLERVSNVIQPGDLYTDAQVPDAPLLETEEQKDSQLLPTERILRIAETIEWSNIETYVNNDLGNPEQIEIYIDIAPAHKNTDDPLPKQVVADVRIENHTEISNNVIEGELSGDFRGELERKLRIYDGDYVNYKNTLLLEDSASKIVRSKNWKDAYPNIDDVKLQNALIHDLAQQYNTARHAIKVDLWLNDQSDTFVSLGSIFTYSTQLATKNFIVMGYDYNVKKNAYRITLREHKDYDNFTIV